MARKEYNKLVRDRIPEIIAAEGRKCEVTVLSEEDYRAALVKKIGEEADEIAQAAASELVVEIADLYEVLDALMLLHGIDEDVVRDEQQRRNKERGGFERRLKLLWAECKPE